MCCYSRWPSFFLPHLSRWCWVIPFKKAPPFHRRRLTFLQCCWTLKSSWAQAEMKQQVGPPPVWPTPRLRVRVPPVCNRNSDEALGDALHPFGTTLSYSSGGCRLLSWRHSQVSFLSPPPHSTHPLRLSSCQVTPSTWEVGEGHVNHSYSLFFSLLSRSVNFFLRLPFDERHPTRFIFCMDCFSFYKNQIVNGWNGWGKGRWGEMVHFHSCFFFFLFFLSKTKLLGLLWDPSPKRVKQPGHVRQ